MRKSEQLTKLGEDAFNSLIERGGYIKGYGDQYRIMDTTHSPVFNIPKLDMAFLIENGVVVRNELVYVLSENSQSIVSAYKNKSKEK